jgi:hypothetical protein
MEPWKFAWTEKNLSCSGTVMDSGKGEFVVKGKVDCHSLNPIVNFIAPNPPTYLTSFSGSGLPYPNAEVAYENTPNKGMVRAPGGFFEFRLRYPNAYYVGLGTVYVEPCVHIRVCEEDGSKSDLKTIILGKGIPYRSLTYPPTSKNVAPRSSPLFYAGMEGLPVRTSEQITREADYPSINKMPDNFWGTKPPM